MTSSAADHRVLESPAPVSRANRIDAIDSLRGLAVLGLMAVHILVFSQPLSATGDPRASLPYEGANAIFIWGINVLVMGKFMFLFALLFGAGVMFFDRKTAGERLLDGAGLWYRRMGWLAVIGILHGVLLFFGDILLLYAICGMAILWWVRRLPTGWLMAFAAGMYAIGIGALGIASLLALVYVPGNMDEAAFAAQQIEAYRGSYLDATIMRLMFLLNTYMIMPFITFWLATGVMLFGMVLMRMDVLTGRRSTRFYAVMAIVGLTVGLAGSASLFNAVVRSDFDISRTLLWATLFQPVGIPLSLAYLSIIMLLAKLDILRPAQVAIAAVGRMALTNYLLHSLLGAVIFQGWGFGLYAKLEFPALFGIVLGVWTINIVFSLLWLRYFRFGPVEWLWRSLTYLKLQPLRRDAALLAPSAV